MALAAADSVVLDRDEKGNPRAFCMFALFVEAKSRWFAAAAGSRPAKNDLFFAKTQKLCVSIH